MPIAPEADHQQRLRPLSGTIASIGPTSFLSGSAPETREPAPVATMMCLLDTSSPKAPFGASTAAFVTVTCPGTSVASPSHRDLVRVERVAGPVVKKFTTRERFTTACRRKRFSPPQDRSPWLRHQMIPSAERAEPGSECTPIVADADEIGFFDHRGLNQVAARRGDLAAGVPEDMT